MTKILLPILIICCVLKFSPAEAQTLQDSVVVFPPNGDTIRYTTPNKYVPADPGDSLITRNTATKKRGLLPVSALPVSTAQATAIGLKVAIADTAGMLSKYYRKSDTALIVANYLRKIDTATVVGPYLRKFDTTTMIAPYLRKADTAAMLSTYARTIAVNAKADLAGALFSGAVGYAAGAGSTVTQNTNKSTGVTLNKLTGEITLNNAALAAATIVSFTLTNSTITATDVIILNHVTTGTRGAYTLNAQCANGSAVIYVRNNTAGSLGEAIVIRYVVIRGQIN